MPKKAPKALKNKKKSSKVSGIMACYSSSLFIASILALGLSAYSVYVASRVSEDDEYEALCDFGPQISCTKAFSSEASKGFGIAVLPDELKVPNGIYGIVFYAIFASLCFTKNLSLVKVQLGLSVTAVLVSIYLAYVSYFVLYNLCIVCVSTYIINVVNIVLVIKKFKQLRVPVSEPTEKAEKQD